MRVKFLSLVLVLTGCGGESFTAFGPEGSQDAGTGGAVAADSGPQATGGASGETGGTADVDSGDAHASAGGEPSSGGATSTGGTLSSTGGVGTGGASSAGGTTSTGGTAGSGGALGTGGAACTSATHSNGLGQTWTDCVPLGTYDSAQALKACRASGASRCVDLGSDVGCGTTAMVLGSNGSGIANFVGQWGYAGSGVGLVGTSSCSAYCPCEASGKTWN